VGESFCHAAPFQYCGSLGPLTLDADLATAIERLGNVLAKVCGLRGLFGVDGILRDGDFFPVEVNPRYTASVEVVEYAAGLRALAVHRRIFDATAPALIAPDPSRPRSFVGKAILMAREDVVFPDRGPWDSALEAPGHIDEMPAFADIPKPDEHIRAGRPILTLFVRSDSLTECEARLRAIAFDLDRCLFGC
jgi:predicted ATP-grasp superfamily ATP-dependent carboligase